MSEKNAKNQDFIDNTFQSNFSLTHIDSQTNKPKQVDISEKLQPNETKTPRVACASGYIQLNETTFSAIANDELKKGNALIVAQLAGISASKQTSHLIPLCHQILLDLCDVDFKCDSLTSRIYCQAVCKTSISKTGVEMEALTACSIALLTIYDMCKAIQKDAVINDVKLEYKYGGKSDYKRSSDSF
jgi:cyclic pyranopterin phosphate synthase